MASYQDIETRLRVIEDKVDLILKAAQVTIGTPSTLVPGEVIKETITMGELYKRLRQTGAALEVAQND